MAWNFTYEQLLERAYKNTPTVAKEEVRFELPEIKSHLSGNKTIISNLEQVAKVLRREVNHFFKFMLRELATTGDVKNSEYIFVGKFRNEFLQQKIGKYAKEFVFCGQCNKRDTHLVREAAADFIVCEACGAKASVRKLK